MNLVLSVVALAVLYSAVDAKHSPAKVQVYSRMPGEFGKDNVLICHVSKFHPPDISIQLLKNGEEMPNAEQTDLAFERDWHFHLTRSVPFTPAKGDSFSCKVTHGTKETTYGWEPNM